MKDIIYNIYLRIRLWVYNKFLKLEVENQIFTPRHSLDLKEDFEIGMPWGKLHPNMPYQCMTEDSVEYLDDGSVNLNVVKTTKLIEHNGLTYYPEIDAGSLYSKKEYLYGNFEIECSIPETDFGWPSFWLLPDSSWPPEIDIFEFITGSGYDTTKKMSSTIHYLDNKGERKMIGGAHELVEQPIIKVRLEWSKDYLKWYYEDILYRKITTHMEQFQVPMRIIVGTGASDKYYSKGLLYEKYKIRNIKYRKL